jgi:hypothetical protein
MKFCLLSMSCLLAVAAIADGNGEPLHPFVLPWDDASPGITDMSGLLGKPAGQDGLAAAKDGHLYEGGKRFRIFGVNTVFGANFPTHADAEKVAARMAKFGIDCVRFHHMDNQTSPTGIWNADMRTMSPEQLDKLDYFIAQLKKNGIYADLNLHVSREYPGMPKWDGMPGYFKGVDLFYPPMIQMQKDYARQLLTHVNAYTKNAYVDEPAVALIEINNENGLIQQWAGGSLDSMSAPYEVELGELWNRWLSARYATGEALQKAWATGAEPLGPEMLKETSFEKGAGADSAWLFEQHEEARASATPAEGGLLVSVRQESAEGWHVQFSQRHLAVSANEHYTVTFRAKADAPERISIGVSQASAPWESLWSANVKLTGEWQKFQFTFQPAANEQNARLIFSNLALEKGNYLIADVSLRSGGISGLQDNETLGTMPVFKKSDFGQRTAAAQDDWMRFLYETEAGYWTGMERFIKDDLKAHSLVVGSATGFSPPSIQAKLDVVDVHAYWQHPHFPHKPWDPQDWSVRNIPMAGAPDGGTMPGLMERRVAGKPYICTEYNEAAPNTHASEAFLLANAYAALQDWDGIFVFAYSHRLDDWNSQRICSFFDLDQHPTKLATLPAAVSLFLRGDVSKAKETITCPVSWNAAIEKSISTGPWWDMSSFGVAKEVALVSRVQIDTAAQGAAAPNKPSPVYAGFGKPIISDTGELTWGSSEGVMTIDTPRSKAFIGKIKGDAIKLTNVTFEPGRNRQDWAAITVTAMDGRDIGSSGRILITATGDAENTGMRWGDPQKYTLAGGDWGTAPSLVEVIPAKITLPVPAGKTKVWSLDGRGLRAAEVAVSEAGRSAVIDIGPPAQTLWYEVDVSADQP